MTNWALAGRGGFQNALATGLQLGTMARQRQEERDQRNALAAYATDPSEQNFAGLAQARPDIAIRERTRIQAQQQQQAEADLTTRFLNGDETAGDQLAQMNFERYSKIEDRQRAQAVEEAKIFGEAALDISKLPYAQRRGRIIGYAQQFPQYAEQINQIAYLPEEEQNAALRAAIAEAGLMQRLHRMEAPQPFNVGPGEGRYERDPRTGAISTIVEPNYGQGPSFSPVPQPYPEGTVIENEAGVRLIMRNGKWSQM